MRSDVGRRRSRSSPDPNYYPACERCGKKFKLEDDHAVIDDNYLAGDDWHVENRLTEYGLCKDCAKDVCHWLETNPYGRLPTTDDSHACGGCGGIQTRDDGIHWITMERVGWSIIDDDRESLEEIHGGDIPANIENNTALDFVLCDLCHDQWCRWLDRGRGRND